MGNMAGKRLYITGRIIRHAAMAGMTAFFISCEGYTGIPDMQTDIVICPGIPGTRSEDPDEYLITDANIFVFNTDGLLEEHLYLNAAQLCRTDDGSYTYPLKLLKGCVYSVYVCTNTGFSIPCGTLEELLDYRFYLAYPDDYRIGIPMSGERKEFEFTGEEKIQVQLRRAMAKISVRIDRSGLDEGIEFNVTRLQVGNCPRSVRLFGESSVEYDNGSYISGFEKSEGGTDPLNTNETGQTSGEVHMFMFENLQGRPLGDIDSYEEKVFREGDPLERRCSYIELEAEYISSDYYSGPGKGLVYRFYLGDSPSDFNVERNCHYHITVRPEGTGLDGNGWRVDKSGLEYRGPVSMSVSPGNYIRGKIGDRIHIRCDIVPSHTPLDIGKEHLEYDRERGIYDYVIDDDGKGVGLILKGSGSGLIYIEAGEPVNDAALIVVEVDLPYV